MGTPPAAGKRGPSCHRHIAFVPLVTPLTNCRIALRGTSCHRQGRPKCVGTGRNSRGPSCHRHVAHMQMVSPKTPCIAALKGKSCHWQTAHKRVGTRCRDRVPSCHRQMAPPQMDHACFACHTALPGASCHMVHKRRDKGPAWRPPQHSLPNRNQGARQAHIPGTGPQARENRVPASPARPAARVGQGPATKACNVHGQDTRHKNMHSVFQALPAQSITRGAGLSRTGKVSSNPGTPYKLDIMHTLTS